MTPQFKWLMYSIILTILLNLILGCSTAQPKPEPLMCDASVELAEQSCGNYIQNMIDDIVFECSQKKAVC